MDRRLFLTHAGAIGAGAVGLGSTAQAQADAKMHTVAVIGHTGRGNYGHGLDTVWKRLANTRIVAVADPNDGGRRNELSKLGLPEDAGYADYREMLTKVAPDLVAVCPRHVDQHRDMILAAIHSGAKGLYVEKPFVRTPAEADEVLAASESQGAKIAVAHRNRYHPVLQVVKQLINDGRIGRVLEIRGRGKGDRRGGGEDLWVLGSHVLNMIQFLAGKPHSCSAELIQDGRRAGKSDVREGAEGLGPLAGNELHARFHFDSGITAYFDSLANDGTKNHGFGLHVVGSEGRIAVFADGDPLAYLLPGNPFAVKHESSRWIPISSGGVDVPEPDPELVHAVQHHDVAALDLIEAIVENREPICSGAEAALTVEMICGVFESHRQGGAAVSFPLVQREHPLGML